MAENTPNEYFTFIRDAKKKPDDPGAAALNSLDIIDSKASGLTGLIGGFSAAAFFMVETLITSENATASLPTQFAIGAAIAFLSASGVLCGTCLFILSHRHGRLFKEGSVSSDILLAIYRHRVLRYLLALRFLYIGISLLAVGTVYDLVETTIHNMSR